MKNTSNIYAIALLLMIAVITLSFTSSKDYEHSGEVSNEVIVVTDYDDCKWTFTTNFNRITVEVADGQEYHCSEKKNVKRFTLKKGEKHTLYGEFICYRRKSPGYDWTNWTKAVMCMGKPLEVQVR
ncbi:hypothetical protein [Kordia jejudonensis]|uniref:hypothetical protein n=1 Tax=Kordia jejudonensis TaxID=1348245 RepID=UPI00062975B2|nr:hypothetical protein [Kordia jejudonensis]